MNKSMFDKLKVHLWIAGTVDQEGNGGWSARMECFIGNSTYSKTIGGYAKNTTITRMTLKALLEGLLLLKADKPVFVEIYTSVVQVSTGLNRNMYQWAKRGWKTTKNETPKHVDLWQQIYNILTDTNRTLAYRVHLQGQANNHQPQRLFAMHTSAKYLAEARTDMYEVQLA